MFIKMSVWERGKAPGGRDSECAGSRRRCLPEQRSHQDYSPAYFSIGKTSPFGGNLNSCPYRQKGVGKLKAVWSGIEVSSELSSASNGRLMLMFYTMSVDSSIGLWKSFLSFESKSKSKAVLISVLKPRQEPLSELSLPPRTGCTPLERVLSWLFARLWSTQQHVSFLWTEGKT